MEEDIKVLEEYVQEFNENKKKYKLAYSTGFGKFWSDFVKTIENLINRNKQLEEIEKEHKKENGELRERIKELESELQHKNDQLFLGDTQWGKYIDKNYIPKSKVKELIEKYKCFKWKCKDDEYWANRILDGFEELLEERN